MPTIDVIIVSWNSGEPLQCCLASLAASSTSRFRFDRVIVVDNASTVTCRPKRHDTLPDVTLIANDKNRGFAAACNQGAAGSQADYLLFVNPDAVLAPEALDRAVAAFETRELRDVAVLGLQLIDAAGVPQATCGRFLTAGGILNQLTGLSRIAPDRLRGFRMTEWDHGDSRVVDYVSAACSLVRRPVFMQLHGFDEEFRVYLEDADFAVRAKRAGWRSYFLADAAAWHEGGWATGRDRALRLAYAWRSLLVYERKHFGPLRGAALIAATLAVAPLARLGEAASRASWLEARQALAGYVRLYGLLARDLARRRQPAPRSSPAAVRPALHTAEARLRSQGD